MTLTAHEKDILDDFRQYLLTEGKDVLGEERTAKICHILITYRMGRRFSNLPPLFYCLFTEFALRYPKLPDVFHLVTHTYGEEAQDELRRRFGDVAYIAACLGLVYLIETETEAKTETDTENNDIPKEGGNL